MRILRWRSKLAEYDYDVLYKAGKTNVNANTLSRNPVDLEEANCNIINHHKLLNLNDAETISKMLKESDEEDEDFKLYSTDDEPFEDLLRDDNPPEERTNSISITQKETEKSQ